MIFSPAPCQPSPPFCTRRFQTIPSHSSPKPLHARHFQTRARAPSKQGRTWHTHTQNEAPTKGRRATSSKCTRQGSSCTMCAVGGPPRTWNCWNGILAPLPRTGVPKLPLRAPALFKSSCTCRGKVPNTTVAEAQAQRRVSIASACQMARPRDKTCHGGVLSSAVCVTVGELNWCTPPGTHAATVQSKASTWHAQQRTQPALVRLSLWGGTAPERSGQSNDSKWLSSHECTAHITHGACFANTGTHSLCSPAPPHHAPTCWHMRGTRRVISMRITPMASCR